MTALAETVAAALGGTGHRAQYLQQPGGSDVATEDGGGGGSAGEVARGSSVVVIARWPWNASVGAEDGDLHFAVGELIELDVPSSADGWGSGRLVQRLDAPSGLFPLSYVEELPPVVGDSGGSEAGAQYRQRPADAKMAEKLAAFGECAESIRAALDAAVVGQAEAKQAVLLAILCREHVYIEGPPGVAKTLTAEVAVRAITIYRRMPTSHEHHHEPSKREATSPLPPTQTKQRQPLRSHLAPPPFFSKITTDMIIQIIAYFEYWGTYSTPPTSVHVVVELGNGFLNRLQLYSFLPTSTSLYYSCT